MHRASILATGESGWSWRVLNQQPRQAFHCFDQIVKQGSRLAGSEGDKNEH